VNLSIIKQLQKVHLVHGVLVGRGSCSLSSNISDQLGPLVILTTLSFYERLLGLRK
jgi:hypothetical protein